MVLSFGIVPVIDPKQRPSVFDRFRFSPDTVEKSFIIDSDFCNSSKYCTNILLCFD